MSGRSIHIGLNHVDPNAYGGWDGALSGCINDANAMEALARTEGYSTTLLTDAQATSHRVLQEISTAAATLASGDILLITYSGHGGQVYDANSDETDAMDETWVLYDREIIDDELGAMWAQFAAGVRIFMLSDSCHSGTVAKMMMARAIDDARAGAKSAADRRTKNMPPDVEQQIAIRDRPMYDTLQFVAGPTERQNIRASVILISGCQDNQLSYDGAVNGQFTGTLLNVWQGGAFQGTYREFHQEVLAQMPPEQSPNFMHIGVVDAAFEQQRPFTIAAPGTSIGTSAGTGVPVGSAASSSRPRLELGDQGPDVRYLQERLVAHGHSVSVDGFFGRQTDQAVRAFQAAHSLSVDGIVGSQTWQALEDAGVSAAAGGYTSYAGATPPPAWLPLRRPQSGSNVQRLQTMLVENGYKLYVDGIFGAGTESAVRMFQQSRGQPATGVVDAATWSSLENRPATVLAIADSGKARRPSAYA